MSVDHRTGKRIRPRSLTIIIADCQLPIGLFARVSLLLQSFISNPVIGLCRESTPVSNVHQAFIGFESLLSR